jgi:tetratricopeptide (TPR) repeat protein
MAYSKLKKHRSAIEACKRGLEHCRRIDHGTIDGRYRQDIQGCALPDTLREALSLGSHAVICRSDTSTWVITDSIRFEPFYVICDDGSCLKLAQQPDPLLWARLTNNLGVAYYYLSDDGSRDENLTYAIQHYRESLKVRPRLLFEIDHAKVKVNLGLALEKRAAGKRREDLQEALAAYADAYEIYDARSNHPTCKSEAEDATQRMRKIESRLARLDQDGH